MLPDDSSLGLHQFFARASTLQVGVGGGGPSSHLGTLVMTTLEATMPTVETLIHQHVLKRHSSSMAV